MAWAGTRSYVVQAGMVTGTLTNFPALVVVRDPDFRTFANGGLIQTGHDFAFFVDNAGSPGAITDFEREYHDPVNGDIAYWVRVPSLTVGTRIHIQFGDGAVGASLENKNGVWDSNFKLVDHLANGTTLVPFDSVLPNPATGTLVNGPIAAPGRVKSGAFFDYTRDQSINFGAPAKLDDLTAAFTWSVWIRPSMYPADAYATVMAKDRRSTGTNAWNLIYLKSNGKLFMAVCQSAAGAGSGITYDGTGVHTLTPLLWYYVSMVWTTAVGLRGYVNGILDATTATTTPGVNSAGVNLHIGSDPYFPAARRFPGWMDEVRISNIARSVEWERASYLNQFSPRSFWGVNITLTQTGREQYQNGGVTTLAANIEPTATIFTVAAGSALPQRGSFRTKIGSELALVRAISGNVCSDVIRGAENTVPAAHVAGETVSHVLSAMSLQALPIPGRPSWNRSQVPNDSMFTQLNMPIGAVSSDEAGVVITAPPRGPGYNLIGMFQPAPEPPYTITACFLMCGPHKNYTGFGMHWRGYSGTIATFDNTSVTGEVCALSWNKATSATVWDSQYQSFRHSGWVRWMRISDDGTNRKSWLSPDGLHWIALHSVARADFTNPDFVGWHVYNENTVAPTFGVILRLLSWDVVVP